MKRVDMKRRRFLKATSIFAAGGGGLASAAAGSGASDAAPSSPEDLQGRSRGNAASSYASDASKKADIAWWEDARFGMFVHWGPIALKGTEISWSRAKRRPGMDGGTIPVEEYDSLYERFDPAGFDARERVRFAKDAGMRYLVFTTKHHDDFCMYDSPCTDYDITRARLMPDGCPNFWTS